MPDPALVCEVRTQSGTYSDWLTVSVSQSIETNFMRSFKLSCAEPSGKFMQRLKPGDRVDIALAGEVVVQEGYIVNRQAAFDANRHGVQVEGHCKAGMITKVSAEAGTGQFRGYTVEAIANRLLKPHGVKFRIENPPDGANEPFPNVVVRRGETPYDTISRLCRQRALWIRSAPNGDIVAGAKMGGGLTFTEGENILSANCAIEMAAAATVLGQSQQPGSDSLFGRKAAEISAQSTLSDGISGLSRKVLAEMPLNQKELQLRTNMEAQAIEAARLRVTLAYQGWLNPAGKLWDLSETVTVKSPMLFPTESGQLDLRLWSYDYTQTPEGQTVTSIELVNPTAFNVRFPDGQKSDGFFGAQPTPAQPQAST